MVKQLRFKLMLLLCALVAGGASAWAEDTDVLTASLFTATSTTYADFSGVSATSDAVYAGNSAKTSSGGIQLRSKNSNSGIVSTTSGGDRIKSVSVTVESGSNTLDIYGSNTAYTAASDLYNSSTQGTKIGSLSANGTVTVTGDYKYIGLRSNNGAIYLTNITIVWEPSSSSAIATTTTIDDDGITNTDVYTSTIAGTLSATVTPKSGGSALVNPTITWSSSNEGVATVASNGAVTLVAAGTTTITASYLGVENEYAASSATYELTVTSSAPATTYTLATAVVPGRHYIIVGENDDNYYALGTSQNTNNRSAVAITVESNSASIAPGSNVAEILISIDEETGFFTIFDAAYDNGNGGYLYAAGANSSNYMRTYTSLNDYGRWTISIDNEGVATVVAQGGTHSYMRYNSGNTIFSCYLEGSQNDIYLYERDGDTDSQTTTVNIAAACTDGTKFYGTYSAPFAFIVPEDVAVSAVSVSAGSLVVTPYSTGDVVKANTGVLLSAGSAGNKTITLSAEAGTEKDGNMLRPGGVTEEQMETNDPSCKFYRLTMHNPTTDNTLGFYWGADNGAAFSIDSNKAYLAVPTSLAREGFTFGDETNGIMTNNREAITNNQYFDLQGRRVAQPTKGLYIVNGKKMIVK